MKQNKQRKFQRGRIRSTRLRIALVLALTVVTQLGAAMFSNVNAASGNTKIAIVYSALSEKYFGNEFEFRQLYTAVQSQAVQAGVPFDLLDEADLADMNKLTGYKAVIIPALQSADSSMVSTYKANLTNLLQNEGVAVIAGSSFFSHDENGNYQWQTTSSAMNDIFGLETGVYGTFSNITVTSSGSSHPVTSLLETPDILAEYDSTFYQEFVPVSGQNNETIAWFKHNGNNNKIAIQAGKKGNGKYVHFSDCIKMVDSKILWAVIKWAVSDSDTPSENVHLSLTREKGMFIPRNDMELTRFLSAVRTVEFPLLDILKRWETDFGFKGSFYINIGNKPEIGEYTDWDLSGPLYRDYIAIGNEIGTHSYTHPQDTKMLNASELEYEFNQSQIEIGNEMGVPVNGTGIPGEDENLFVYDNIKQYFEYISGHTLYSESRHIQSLGIGYLTPSEDTVYFSLNMTPDFVLGDILKSSQEEFSAAWIKELDDQSVNMRQPVLHWLWHDYGIINPNSSPYYGAKPYEDIIAYAAASGLEFVTLDEYVNRFKAFQTSNVLVDYVGTNQVDVEVQGANLGGLTVELPAGKTIASAGSHYAYNGNKLFLPENGGAFSIMTGAASDNVTRVTDIDTALELVSVAGDGSMLDVMVKGQGRVDITFRQVTNGKFEVTSEGGSVTYTSEGASVYYEDAGTYIVSVRPTDNLAPYANDIMATTVQAQSVKVVLPAGDYDGHLVNMVITNGPSNGDATIDTLEIDYMPYPGFTGIDVITYQVTDNKGLMNSGIVIIDVVPINLSDGDGSYNYVSREVIIDGDFSEWEGLEMMASDPVDADGPNDKLDYTGVYAAHNATKFFLFYTSTKEAPLNWAHNTFIDVDNLNQTGFILGQMGCDYLVQGGLVYQYTGNGLDWKWEQRSSIIIAQNGNNVELCLDRELFPNTTSIKFALLADNSAYPGGTGLDIFPDDMFSSRTGYFGYTFYSETTNTVPVAQPSNYAINTGESIDVELKGYDMDRDVLTYTVTSMPTKGTLSGTAPNLVYMPDEGATGEDTFMFTVSDDQSSSSPASVTVMINSLPVSPNKMSNIPGSSIFIDGDLTDWNGLTPYTADPIDQGGNGNQLDWTRLRFAHTGGDFYIAYENASTIQFNWAYNLYIDTDTNQATGFNARYAFSGIGAEYLIQSDYIFKYTGDGESWSWEFVGSAQSGIKSNTVEMVLPRAYIGSPEEINVVAFGENFAYPNGDSVDLYPDNASSEGGYHNYYFGTGGSSLGSQTSEAVKTAGPIPPLVPHTLRVQFVEPQALNPQLFQNIEAAKSHFDIRMNARPNSTWDLLHSLDLSNWETARRWQITGTWSEFAFPIQKTSPDGSHGFFDAFETAAPTQQNQQ